MIIRSDKAAQRHALIYSLAISCRLNNVNSFAYFNDVIKRLAKLPPTADYDKLKQFLPNKWAKN